MRILVLGCGYTGERLGLRLLAEGHEVHGTTRSRERAAALAAAGIRPLRLDAGRPGDIRRAAETAPELAFHLIPPPGREPPRPPDRDPAADLLAAIPAPRLRCFVYVGSTSVYGDRGGEWVDETTPPRPDSPLGGARLAAEEAVRRVAEERHGGRARFARVAGIYGPGRTLAESIREGRYHVLEDAPAWSNRIHVDDLVEALRAIALRGRDGEVYNLADGRPHRSAEYAHLVAGLIGAEPATITEREARERYGADRLARKLSSKRVSSRKMREELGVEPRYPDIRAGVPAALRETAR